MNRGFLFYSVIIKVEGVFTRCLLWFCVFPFFVWLNQLKSCGFSLFFFFPLRKTFQLTPELSSPSFWCLIPENQHLQDSVLTLLLNEHQAVCLCHVTVWPPVQRWPNVVSSSLFFLFFTFFLLFFFSFFPFFISFVFFSISSSSFL